MNSAYTVHNSKCCLSKSTNAEKEKKKKKGKRKTLKTQMPDLVESNRPLNPNIP